MSATPSIIRNPMHAALRIAAIAFIVLVACAALEQPACADVHLNYYGPGRFDYTVTHVPDFDQRRSGLPLDGSNYCVPTSAINWMAYFANHGAPWISPGPGFWQSPLRYADATAAINAMGVFMATDPNDGTGGLGSVWGLRFWLGDTPIAVVRQYPTRFWSPKFDDASAHVILGGYVMVGVGWYQNVGEGRIHRNGGHSLSLTYGWRDGPNKIIGWRDPGSDEGDLSRESPFTTETYGINEELRIPTYHDPWPRFMSRVVGYGDGYIDSVIGLHPQFSLTTKPDRFSMHLHHVARPWGSPDPENLFESVERTTIRELVLHPGLLDFCYVADSADPDYPPKLWRVSRATGDAAQVELDLLDPWHIGPMLFGRGLGLYVVDGADLMLCDIDSQPPALDIRVTPPSPVSALTYADDTDELILLSIEGRTLMRYPHHLGAAPIVQDIPPEVRLEERVRIRWDASHECTWVASAGYRGLYRLYEQSGELLAAVHRHPLIRVEPNDVDVDDDGRIFVSHDGDLLEFELNLLSRELEAVDDPYYPGCAAGDVLRVARSATNFDPDIHGGPAWHNVLPQEFGVPILDCPPDMNLDRNVDMADLLAVLTAWGTCPEDRFCHADFDYSTVVDFADVLALLMAWGPCA